MAFSSKWTPKVPRYKHGRGYIVNMVILSSMSYPLYSSSIILATLSRSTIKDFRIMDKADICVLFEGICFLHPSFHELRDLDVYGLYLL